MITIYKNLWWFIKQNRVTYLFLTIGILFISFATTIPPKLVGNIIDLIASNQLTDSQLMIQGGLLILIPLFIFIMNFFYHKKLHMSGQKLSRQLRLMYLGKLFASDAKLYETYSKGDLISRISSDMPAITQAATFLLSDLVYCLSLIVFVVSVMIFQISLKLTVVAFLIIPIIFYFLNLWRISMRKYYKVHRKIFAKYFESILESIEGTRVVRAYVQEENDYLKNEQEIDNDINSWVKIVKFETLFGPLFSTTIAISTFLTFSYGSYLVITSSISPGELITFSMYITMISGPINVLAGVMNVASQAQIAQERYLEVLEIQDEVVSPSTPTNLLEFNSLEFKDVKFKYPFDESYVLNDININFYKGETIGIVGPTGSGKSTIIRQLLREFNVTEGEVLLNGVNIKDYNLENVRGLVGYVPQVHTIFKGSVEENLKLSDQYANEEKIKSAIEIAAFKNDLNNMNNGLQTFVGEHGSGLSGGQKQRLSIARALLKEPQILILDDSLSAVDANTENQIISNLKEKRTDKTNIIITHRFSVVKNAHRIYVVNDGKIIESGNHYELMNNKGWYYEQSLLQAKGSDI